MSFRTGSSCGRTSASLRPSNGDFPKLCAAAEELPEGALPILENIL